MRVVSRANFCKRATCPSAETLISYQAERLSKIEKAKVILHLNQCDFCRAELCLLSHHQLADVVGCQPTEIPKHLRQLVEALLHARNHQNHSFSNEIYESKTIS